jgi:hypothetical protein
MKFTSKLVTAACFADVLAAPVAESGAESTSQRQLGVYFESADALPVLNLPYASYRATKYDKAHDVSLYAFHIRDTVDQMSVN